MLRRRTVLRHAAVGLAGLCLATASTRPAWSQTLEQPVRIIFPFAAGGVGDALGRMMAEYLRPVAGRAVIVENRTGAAGRLGVQAVKNAQPDGSTLLLTPIAPISVYPHFYKDLGYDPFTDLEPLSQLATFEFALAVSKRVPAKSLAELAKWLAANPNEQAFATPGAGTLPHFLALKFGELSGLKLRHVSYKGSAAAVQDLVAGQLPFVVTSTSDFAPHHAAGTIRVLATSAPQPFIPNIPTFEQGGFKLSGNGWYAMYATAKTPASILDKYSKALADGIKLPETRKRLIAMGFQPTGTTRQRLAELQKADHAFWGPIIKASGFTPQQ